MRKFITRGSYSLSSHECAPVGHAKRRVFSLLQNDVSVISVGSRIDNGKEFHSFGSQAAKLCGPEVEVREASTCRSPRAAERISDDGLYCCNGNA